MLQTNFVINTPVFIYIENLLFGLLLIIFFWYFVDEIYFLNAMIFIESINFIIICNFSILFTLGLDESIILSFLILLLFACESVFGLLLLVLLKKNYRGSLLIIENNILKG